MKPLTIEKLIEVPMLLFFIFTGFATDLIWLIAILLLAVLTVLVDRIVQPLNQSLEKLSASLYERVNRDYEAI